MANSLIKWSVIFQFGVAILVRGISYYSEIEQANWLSVETLAGFLEDLTLGTLLFVAFWQLFPGQVWGFLALPCFAIFCLWKSRGEDKRLLFISLFHVFSTIWVVFPIVANSFGTYRGP